MLFYFFNNYLDTPIGMEAQNGRHLLSIIYGYEYHPNEIQTCIHQCEMDNCAFGNSSRE